MIPTLHRQPCLFLVYFWFFFQLTTMFRAVDIFHKRFENPIIRKGTTLSHPVINKHSYNKRIFVNKKEWTQLKSKVGHILAKAAALRIINLNIDGNLLDRTLTHHTLKSFTYYLTNNNVWAYSQFRGPVDRVRQTVVVFCSTVMWLCSRTQSTENVFRSKANPADCSINVCWRACARMMQDFIFGMKIRVSANQRLQKMILYLSFFVPFEAGKGGILQYLSVYPVAGRRG